MSGISTIRIILRVFLFTLISTQIFSQNRSLRFQHYTMEDGLPQNLVDCILQDSKGFMWFGTWSGLARFDGYSFKVYRQQSTDYSTISNNYIYSLCEDYNGNIWIGTNNGVNIYRYNYDVFQYLESENTDYKVLREKTTAIALSKDSSIWIGTTSGLSHIILNSESSIISISTYTFGKDVFKVSGSLINHILEDSKSNLWISTNNGISVLMTQDNEFKFFNSDQPNTIPHSSVKSTFEDSEGLIWIATEFGLARYDPVTDIFTTYNYDDLNRSEYSLPHRYIMSIAEDARGDILIGTFGGLSVFKKNGSENFINYKENSYSEYSLNNEFINCIYKDRFGHIWIGTERGGINKYNSAKSEFEYFECEVGKENTLSSNVINSVYEDNNTIWIGTAGGGLNKYNKRTGKFEHYQYKIDNQDGLSINNFISAIHRDKQNNLWIGSWGSGLYKLINENTKNERFINYRPQYQSNSLIDDYVSSIISDSQGNLWIGTYEGLDNFILKSKKFEHIVPRNIETKINRVGYLLFDNENNLWVGTVNGLFKIQFRREGDYLIKHFTKDEKRKNSLSDNYITTLYQDAKNNLWIGTYGFGLNRLISEKAGGEFITLTMEDGLPNNIIYRILEDNSGNIWMTTDYGLSRFTPDNNKFKNFFIADGLQNNQYYWNAAYKNEEGKLYFGGLNGLNTFYPDSILSNSTEYDGKVVITDFKIYNESVKSGNKYYGHKVLTQSITSTSHINITYKAREISFEFSALNYDQPASIQYAYMLEGFEQKWNEIDSDRRYASYTNLKPDKYIFRVKSTNSNGEWLDTPTSIDLYIKPPFWATWPFKIALFILAIGLIVFYIKYRVYALKRHKQELELQVKERTAEIEKQKKRLEAQNEQIHKQRDNLFELNKKVRTINKSKIKFFTNISHEFRTPITLIIGPIERLLKFNPGHDEIHKTLTLVYKNAQRLLNLINQLMDFRKIEQGKMKLHVSKISINEFLENIMKAFGPLSELQGITLNFHPIDNEGETWFDFQKMENVMYNLLSNAFKYTPYNGTIDINVYNSIQSALNYTIQVSDTGSGIQKEKQEFIFNRFYQVESEKDERKGTGIGLSLTKEIVECHHGTISLESTINLGTTFFVDIPVRKNCFSDSEITGEQYEPSSLLEKQIKFLASDLLVEESSGLLSTGKNVKVKGRPTVLIIEDNKDLRKFITEKLGDNHNMIEASNGKIGYELACSESPDVIISDIMMPEMNGLELCNKIKTNLFTSHIPVILLTARGEIEDELEGLETGADRYLSKPFHFELLEANINNLIESRKRLFEVFQFQKQIDAKVLATTSIDEEFLQQIVRIIEENLDNPEFNVTYLAEKLNISRGHLHKKLISLANLSPIDFISNIRLKKALHLINNTALNISEIGYAVGYNDPKYFSRQFKKQFGKTPSDYQLDTRKVYS